MGLGGKKIATKERRWYKDIGLGYKTPAEAISGTYVGECFYRVFFAWSNGVHLTDKKCPFVGNVSIRGRILTGRVISTKMTRTLVIRRDYLHYIPKYSASDVILFCARG